MKTKKLAQILACISLISGLFFISQGMMTGNTILTGLANASYFSYLDIIGISLIICSVVLGIYSIKKKE